MRQETATVDKEHLIRKYANRRLYDATASRHVTFEDIRNVIVAGAEVKVVDDKSGADITRATLLHRVAGRRGQGSRDAHGTACGTRPSEHGTVIKDPGR